MNNFSNYGDGNRDRSMNDKHFYYSDSFLSPKEIIKGKPKTMMDYAIEEGLNRNVFFIGNRFLTDIEICKKYPVPPPFSMWGSPAGHLRQYTDFGGNLKPIKIILN